jgi:hypothetical protein
MRCFLGVLSFWLIALGDCAIDFAALFQILTPKSAASRTVEFQNLSCFKHWHERDKHQIQKHAGYTLNRVKYLLKQPKCHLRSPKIVLSFKSDLFTPYIPFFTHFPHFSDFYFPAYSILLWQRSLYPQLQQNCIQDILIPSSVQNFWTNIQSPLWNQQLVLAVNRIFGRNVLISETYPPETANRNITLLGVHKVPTHVFFHPSDAIFLTATILNHHPCEASQQQQKQQLLQEIQLLNITIINRKSRGLLNIQEMVKSVSNLTQGKVTIYDFEGISFQKQVSIMFSSDIIITSHGAALTNIVFMKPCSVVIEILPWLYHGKRFFHRFAASGDLLHYEWMETPENSIRHPLPSSSSVAEVQDDSCSEVIKQYLQEYSQNSTYRQLDEQENYYSKDSLNQKCSQDAHCFSCARSLYGLNASTRKLETLLLKGIVARRACLKAHPYYSS